MYKNLYIFLLTSCLLICICLPGLPGHAQSNAMLTPHNFPGLSTSAAVSRNSISTPAQGSRIMAFQVSGTVNSGITNLPLQGVTVTSKENANAVTTDEDGRYAITIPGPKGTLIFSYTGYTNMEVPVNSQQTIDVVL